MASPMVEYCEQANPGVLAEFRKLGTVFGNARRIQTSFVAKVEKRALLWLAERTPGWVNSDHLTVLGFLGQVGAGICYALSGGNQYFLPVGIGCLAVNWLGDSLDGTLARYRSQQRPRYGFYVDHMVDIFGAVALMCGLGWSGFLHWPVAIAMLIGFLLLAGESYLATYTLDRFQLSQGLFGPTEIRLLLVAGNLALLRDPYCTLFGYRFLLFDAGGLIAAVIMFGIAAAVTVRHTAQLYRQEPLK